MNTIQAIRDTMRECEIVIADDGEMTEEKEGIYSDLIKDGHQVIIMPYDSGFGTKSNKIINSFTRDHLLVSSDDFDHRPLSVRTGIERLLEVLENTDVDIASGRVNNNPYEFDLEDLGDTIIEHRVNTNLNPVPWFVSCSLTVNYSLYKRHVFQKVCWDELEPKIGGGEHGMHFLDVQRAGFKVAWVPGVSISEQQGLDSPRYRQLRMRSSNPARPCCDKRGVRKYILGSGKIDYEKKV